jgi:hypothetical protein
MKDYIGSQRNFSKNSDFDKEETLYLSDFEIPLHRVNCVQVNPQNSAFTRVESQGAGP